MKKQKHIFLAYFEEFFKVSAVAPPSTTGKHLGCFQNVIELIFLCILIVLICISCDGPRSHMKKSKIRPF